MVFVFYVELTHENGVLWAMYPRGDFWAQVGELKTQKN